MKTLLLSLMFSLSLVSFREPVMTRTVFICDSGTAYVYHSRPDCRGLNKCSHEIIEVPLSDAINRYGRRACKLCD